MRRLVLSVVVLSACTSATETLPALVTTASTVAPTTTAAEIPGVRAEPGVGDRMFPHLGNAGYDVTSYDIALAVDSTLTDIEGAVTMEAVANVPLASFAVDFVGFTVTAVAVDGEPADFERDARDMRITPAKTIPAGDEFTVNVDYHGAPRPVDLTDLPFPTGWQRGDGMSVFLFSEPDGASGVFPVNDHPTDRADVVLRVTVRSPHVVVSGGTATPVVAEGDLRTYRFDIPMVAPYLIP
ncbi:MAG: hypothetical protein WD204_04010, partial [Acidimicrobiia bacterium]